MEYRRMGQSGLKLSEFSFGAWVTFATQLDLAGAKELLVIAHGAGVNFFDNAEGYARGGGRTADGSGDCRAGLAA